MWKEKNSKSVLRIERPCNKVGTYTHKNQPIFSYVGGKESSFWNKVKNWVHETSWQHCFYSTTLFLDINFPPKQQSSSESFKWIPMFILMLLMFSLCSFILDIYDDSHYSANNDTRVKKFFYKKSIACRDVAVKSTETR